MRYSALALLLGLSSLACVACGGSSPKPQPVTSAKFVRAQPAPESPRSRPVVIPVPQPPRFSGQFKPLPSGSAALANKAQVEPKQVIADANRKAAQVPDEHGYFNAVLQYAFEPGTLFQVYTAPMRVTDIVLQPGEKIVGQPASGDVVRWILALGKSVEGGLEQVHVYIKPTRPDLETNLAINTDKRTYLLELHSYAETYMAAVKWRYPQDEVARMETQAAELDVAARSSSPIVALDSLNFNYATQVIKGSPGWTPVQIFDDGRRTFIRFPATMLVREAPALFVLRDKETQLVNYRQKGDFYVIDRLIDSAELRVGQQDQEIVRIVRTTSFKG